MSGHTSDMLTHWWRNQQIYVYDTHSHSDNNKQELLMQIQYEPSKLNVRTSTILQDCFLIPILFVLVLPMWPNVSMLGSFDSPFLSLSKKCHLIDPPFPDIDKKSDLFDSLHGKIMSIIISLGPYFDLGSSIPTTYMTERVPPKGNVST
jgi:hypothetical protein